MPLPFIIGGLAAVAGIAGVGSGIRGGVQMRHANVTMKTAQEKQECAVKLFEQENSKTTALMDEIGKKELEILSSFEKFSDIIEKIQNRPKFVSFSKEGIQLPEYKAEELKKVSAGAGLLLGGAGGAAVGTAGGFAAAGATTSAVMAIGTASTGTAISSLSGVAATNATLAALGGGSIAAGGGGMALGTAVLGGATLGVGLLVGGVIFNITGSKLSDKADEAYNQAERTEKEVDRIVAYIKELRSSAIKFKSALTSVEEEYRKRLNVLDCIINEWGKQEWGEFSVKEKKTTENTILLVGLLYKMCQVKLVLKNKKENELNTVNKVEIEKTIQDVQAILENINGQG